MIRIFATLKQRGRAQDQRPLAALGAGIIRGYFRIGINHLVRFGISRRRYHHLRERLAGIDFQLILPPEIIRNQGDGDDHDAQPHEDLFDVGLHPRPQFEKISRCCVLRLHNERAIFLADPENASLKSGRVGPEFA
jgi:hypothetical protein